MSDPYVECKVTVDYPGRVGQRTQTKQGKVTTIIDNGIPKLLVHQGTKKIVVELDNDDISTFALQTPRIEEGIISIEIAYSYGTMCHIVLSEPNTYQSLCDLVEALVSYIR
ncbi:Uncharacterized protein QTN25_002604 [Entamoeba marina]